MHSEVVLAHHLPAGGVKQEEGATLKPAAQGSAVQREVGGWVGGVQGGARGSIGRKGGPGGRAVADTAAGAVPWAPLSTRARTRPCTPCLALHATRAPPPDPPTHAHTHLSVFCSGSVLGALVSQALYSLWKYQPL